MSPPKAKELLQGPAYIRLMFLLFFGVIGLGAAAAALAHSRSILQWTLSGALSLVVIAVLVRILIAGLVVDQRGVLVRSYWRSSFVPWSEVASVDLTQMASRSVTGYATAVTIRTRAGGSLRTQALTAAKPDAPSIVHATDRIAAIRSPSSTGG